MAKYRFAALALALTACGGATSLLAPPLAVREAARSTFAQRATSFTFTLTGSDKDIAALFGEGGALDPEDEKALAVLRDSRLTLSADNGADATSPDDDRVAVDIELGGIESAFELRMIEGRLFARADASAIAKLFDAPPGAIDEGLAMAKGMGLGFLADAAAGRWLSMDLGPLRSFLEGLAGEVPQVGAAQAQSILDALVGAWEAEADVERLGTDATGERYRLSVGLRQIFERLLPLVESLGLPGPLGGAALPSVDQLPAGSVEADVWVRDGKLVRVEFDPGQLSDTGGAGGRAVLRVDITARPDPITAPEDSVEVDLFEVFGRLGAAAAASPGPRPTP